MKYIVSILVGILLIGAVFGILWSASNDFGQRQAVEFFPYSDEITLDDGSVIRSSGVTIKVNHLQSVSSDQEMAALMVAAMGMYPDECSGENYEVAVRRPGPDGAEEKYSYTFSVYDTLGTLTLNSNSPVAASRIEYGRWIDDHYTVLETYDAEWSEIARIASGQSNFQIQFE